MPNYGHLSLSCTKIERPLPLEKPSCKVQLFAQNRSRNYRQKVTVTTLFQTISHPGFQLLSQTPHVCFHGRKCVTHSALLKGSHTRAYTAKHGPSGRGRYHYPRHVLHVHEHPRAGCQNGKLCHFWVLAGGTLEERRGPSEQRCAYARRCPTGVAAPLGCVILFLLSKLRLVCPALRAFPCVRGEGWYHYPRSVPHVSETLRGQGVERQTLPFSEVGCPSLIPVAQKQKQHLTANSPGSL